MYIKIELTACIGLPYDKVSVQEWSKCNSTSLWRKRTLATGVSASAKNAQFNNEVSETLYLL